jgi:hypothetical protein
MWILALSAIYVVAGMVFATWFVIAGAERLDPAVKGSGAGFRLLIAPASAALWPVLLVRSLRRHA